MFPDEDDEDYGQDETQPTPDEERDDNNNGD